MTDGLPTARTTLRTGYVRVLLVLSLVPSSAGRGPARSVSERHWHSYGSSQTDRELGQICLRRGKQTLEASDRVKA